MKFYWHNPHNYAWLVFFLLAGTSLRSQHRELVHYGNPLTGTALCQDQFEVNLIEAERITKLGEHHYLFDFGKAAFGTLEITAMEKTNGKLQVHLGEKLAASNGIDRNPGGSIRYQRLTVPRLPAKRKLTLALPPDQRNTGERAIVLPDSFGVIMPFRYCEIENLRVGPEQLSVRQKSYNYSFDDLSGNFTSSDTLLNQVWDLCKHSIKATSFTGFYIDGDRERIPYEADAYINQMSHYCVDSEYSMARRTNEYFMTHPTWPTEWILHTVLLFYYDFLYTGDIEPVSRHYEALKLKTLIDLQREDGLIASGSEMLDGAFMLKLGFKDSTQRIRDIVDWPPAQKDTGWKLATEQGERDGYEMTSINTVVNSFHYFNLKLMAELAVHLGRTDDADFFHKKSIRVKETINQKLMDHSRGIYIDGEGSGHSSLHANMFPLAFGIVSEEDVESVIAFVKSRGMACSVYGAQYLLEGLYKYGEADYALDLMTSTGDRSWWNMIRLGSTVTLEAWDMKYKPNADWNHAWGAAPANIISRHLWGIRPVAPGFSKVRIHPQFSDLNFSSIKVPTIHGAIHGQYSRAENNVCLIELRIPEKISYELELDPGEDYRILINGRELIPSEQAPSEFGP